MKPYQYQIIRYMHDHFTGEYVNVGVVVYSKAERFLACKITSRYHRITHMFPDANGKWIMKVLNNFNYRVNKLSKELSELFTPPDQLEQVTASIWVKDDSALRLTVPAAAIDISLEAALEDLFSSQVEKYMLGKNQKDSLLDEDVWRMKYKQYFDKYGIDKRLSEHTVKIPKDTISFDKSWKNEIWHCYEPLSFVLQERDSVRHKVYTWAGKLKGLQQSDEPLHLMLLTSLSEQHKDLIPFINEYLKVKTGTLKVEIVTEDQAEEVALQIKKEMDRHDQNH